MSSEERSTWIVGVSLVVVFGWYFTKIIIEAATTPVDAISYQGLLAVMVVVFMGVVVAGHIALAVITRSSPGRDERDRRVDRFGEFVGGYVLGTGILALLIMAALEVEYFWIAHVTPGCHGAGRVDDHRRQARGVQERVLGWYGRLGLRTRLGSVASMPAN